MDEEKYQDRKKVVWGPEKERNARRTNGEQNKIGVWDREKQRAQRRNKNRVETAYKCDKFCKEKRNAMRATHLRASAYSIAN